jgi:hypothetical protein
MLEAVARECMVVKTQQAEKGLAGALVICFLTYSSTLKM